MRTSYDTTTAGRFVGMQQCTANQGLILHRCLRRIGSWRVPPNWSVNDWLDEMRAIGEVTAFYAECEYDSSRGVPFDAFVYQRIVMRAFTRYRQEWAYALHCLPHDTNWETTLEAEDDREKRLTLAGDAFRGPDNSQDPDCAWESLREALSCLSGANRDLLQLLFWEGHTESQIANHLGISQPAVNKRKRAALHQLEIWLKPAFGSFVR